MKKILILFLLIPTFAFSQGWERTYGKGEGRSVQQTTDGGYILTGNSYSSNTLNDVILIKTNGNGDTLWTKTYNKNPDDVGCSVQQTKDSGYIIAGYTGIYGVEMDVYLIKTDNIGDTLWTKTYCKNLFDNAYFVQQTKDKGFIIIGSTTQPGKMLDIYVMKTDSIGDTLWTKTFGGYYYDNGASIEPTTDGGYIIGGVTASYGIGYLDTYLIKIDSTGNIIWAKNHGKYYDDWGCSARQTTDGGYIIAGFSKLLYNGYSDVYLVKTNSSGDTLWTKTYGGNLNDEGCSVQQTTDGGYIIAGLTESFSIGDTNVYLIKTNGSGDTLWTKTFGGISKDYGLSVEQTIDGGYIITGTKDDDIYLIKTDGNGNTTFINEIQIPNNERKLIKVIDVLGREIIYPKKNIPYIEIYDDGSTEKKVILE